MLNMNLKEGKQITINGVISILIKSARNKIVRLGIIADPAKTKIDIGDGPTEDIETVNEGENDE